jgi:glycosyltransferase involved in cell wall biosynthesis/SAM-dependent methyltransferase
MVVHNACEMVKMSILRTLRHSGSLDARLVVVDNASVDGTAQWLDMLAQRGDIDLIRSETNIGHGPGIELARKQIHSPYLVTLDSDAFPLVDDWLPRLRARLQGSVKVVGIRHHRDYIHPSCLMVARQTLENLGVTFLNEKDQPNRFDVAERISYEIKRRGYHIAGLERTGAQRRGSISEPVYLGSTYEGIVYHQWYTTRAAAGRKVDDVPTQAIERSLQELFDDYHAETREITVVMGVRAAPDEPLRLRNAKACLQALNMQDMKRWRYRIVVVEQDSKPRLEAVLTLIVDRYIFAYNPGPYNRGWAFNIGAALPSSRSGVLCLIDADLLVPPNFLRRGLEMMRTGRQAVRPYSEIVCLDAAETERVLQDHASTPLRALDAWRYLGRTSTTSQGGCTWVDATLYLDIGGHDERFQGWGREDREFWDRLSRAITIETLSGRLLHLHHERPAMSDRWAIANQQLYAQLSERTVLRPSRPIGDLDLYSAEDSLAPVADADPELGKREWENWHRWDITRLQRIVPDEKRQPPGTSARRQLADILVRLGDSLLDVGCGPGALWVHLEPHRPRFTWTGADVTKKMVALAQRLFPQVPVHHADAGSLPFEDSDFDIVLLRHVLEHLPPWLMENALAEAIRVSRRTVVLVFHLSPTADGARHTTRVSQGFLQTRWIVTDIEMPITRAGWLVRKRLTITGAQGETDDVWIVMSPHEVAALEQTSEAAAPWETLKISIIMPTYRRAHTILRTVETIRTQTYRNWELIIIDNMGDGGYHFDDPRIRVYCHDGRPSASYARNQGLQYATGDAVCFFDDDDDMFPNYLERCVAAFQAYPNAKLVRCGIVLKGGRTIFSYATPQNLLRRQFATPTWTEHGPGQDRRYFTGIISDNGWSEEAGDIVVVREALCRARRDPRGGLRSGSF